MAGKLKDGRPRHWNWRNWPSQGGSGARPSPKYNSGPGVKIRYRLKRHRRYYGRRPTKGPIDVQYRHNGEWKTYGTYETEDEACAVLEVLYFGNAKYIELKDVLDSGGIKGRT
jgi:hypothetical protein